MQAVAAVHTLLRDPDNLDTIILMNQESDLPGRVRGRPSAKCSDKKEFMSTQNTIHIQRSVLILVGPRLVMSTDVSCLIPRIQGKAGVINYKCPEIG